MPLEDLRKKVLYNNSIEIWIKTCEEKNIVWYETENYKKFIAFLQKNDLNMRRQSICFDESDNISEAGGNKKRFANKLAESKDETSACYIIKLNDPTIELIRNFSL